MKTLLITGGPAVGKSFLLMHLAQHCRLHVLEPEITSAPFWVPPQGLVDAVVLDHFAGAPNIAEIIKAAMRWCEVNNCPIIFACQAGSSLSDVLRVLPDDLLVLSLERDYSTNRVRVTNVHEVEELSLESLTQRVIGLIGIEAKR
ncbi:hypothetical protein [Pseudomonas syringae]|uniref:hypothetical protein n=1 Tax=Pseudomonas syringae TaxID=317 RepID=UPI001F487A0E|nr:hypothetical protein [Pseudomonas syringae]MCF5371985.1 hypothetical protein [Pseudomonas syringae]MCF5382018.1 hypothetical protein [Pseudomonas syringae]MCF5419449.1 hypothetical protein [Pseudomonas syringae]MCF5451995.1 hypothetical protein [Pseudomonas syringae]MCF5456282.1 hypothetical protein [Pseudomonas syringae]